MELNLKILTNKFLDCSLQLETTQDKEKLYQDFLWIIHADGYNLIKLSNSISLSVEML